MQTAKSRNCAQLERRPLPGAFKARARFPTMHRRATRKSTSPSADAVGSWIEQHLGAGPITRSRFNGGSSWSSTYIYDTQSGQKFFVKTALSSGAAKMFEGEALGLQAMYDTHTLRIPKVLHHGPIPAGPGSPQGGSFIVMEHLDFSGSANQAELGRQLAQMHLATPADPNAAKGLFGFAVDNTIGGIPQPNGWMDNWVEFFRERRLKHQIELAGDSRLNDLGGKLCNKLHRLFDGVDVKPSVLHGDLWSGNIAAVGGQPAIFDPATYYGHHEAEFGMSWCAGFSGSFYSSYHELIPKAPGFEERRSLYLLYHYLNHYNLFGSGYYGECVHLLERLNRVVK